jgi:hypothetical protein
MQSSSQMSPKSPQEEQNTVHKTDSVNSHPIHQNIAEPLAAKAMLHEHQVNLKDSRVKSVSGGFLDSNLMDAGDAFARLPSGQYIIQCSSIFFS